MPSTAITSQGTIVQIATGSGGAKTITAVAVGNPTILTATAHGFSNGDYITFSSGFTGADAAQLNGLSFTVTNVTTNTFAVQKDTTAKTITAGTATATPTTYTTLGNIKNFNGLDGQASELDISNFASTGKEFLLGLYDGGQVTMDLDIDNSDAGQVAARTAQQASSKKACKIILPAGSTPNISFNAFVKKFSMSGGVDSPLRGNIVLRISGGYTLS